MIRDFKFTFSIIMLVFIIQTFPAIGSGAEKVEVLDDRVRKFLDNHRNQWVDLNIPEIDGKVLYDLIIKNNYKRAIDIVTSTGHSAIWMAWALSKTGGKLITIEIDHERHKKALVNFKAAGLS